MPPLCHETIPPGLCPGHDQQGAVKLASGIPAEISWVLMPTFIKGEPIIMSLPAAGCSASIKRLEPLYGFERAIDLRDAGSSIVAFETWLELGGEVDDPHIIARPEPKSRGATEALSGVAEKLTLIEQLIRGVPDHPSNRIPNCGSWNRLETVVICFVTSLGRFYK